MNRLGLSKVPVILLTFLLIMTAGVGGVIGDRLFGFKFLDKLFPVSGGLRIDQRVVNEESVVIKVAEEVSDSVVTVSAQTPARKVLQFNPFGGGFSQKIEGGTPQDIGTGFIVSSDGLIVTNKHVASVDGATYKVITKDNKEYDVSQISRDPANDIAIIKINASGLKPIELGDSGNLKVGQFVIAIGTALGEFRHTVTTGVISGLGRGITAGSSYQGYVERLDDVIQTDAAINPGNSGGPLLNSLGQAIGINVAVASGAQNIGFSIPINVVKEALNQYKTTGKFASKPFLGVEYQLISQQTAILNNVPQGAYVVGVTQGSPAESAGIKVQDIIVKIEGQELSDKNTLADIIAGKKAGDRISIEIWRDGSTIPVTTTLSEFSE